MLDPVDHLQGRTAAVISNAEEDHQLAKSSIGLELSQPVNQSKRIVDPIDIAERKKSEQPRAVRRFPPKNAVGEDVRFIPGDLLRDEEIDPSI